MRAGAIAAIVFAVAIGVRAGTVRHAHAEHDERLYAALVEQLDRGRGYTLQGHAILAEPWVVGEQYDRALFYHPPGGLAIFWAFHRAFGAPGLAWAQLFCFAIFYWSMLALAWLTLPSAGLLDTAVVAVTAGFTPIVAHVHAHYWLDGPQLAFATAGLALFALGIRQSSRIWIAAAGVMLAWAVATKLNAIVILPVLAGLCWCIGGDRRQGMLATATAVCTGLVGVTVAAWLVVQWLAFGEMFPSWAGKPADRLVATNDFIRYVTEVRGPWSYLRLVPQALPTLLVSLFALPWVAADAGTRRLATLATTWIAGVLLAHVGLGYLGYSKLLRYVILITPAAVLLVALAVGAARRRLSTAADRPWAIALLAALALALVAETARGIAYATVHADRAFIVVFPDLQWMGAMAR